MDLIRECFPLELKTQTWLQKTRVWGIEPDRDKPPVSLFLFVDQVGPRRVSIPCQSAAFAGSSSPRWWQDGGTGHHVIGLLGDRAGRQPLSRGGRSPNSIFKHPAARKRGFAVSPHGFLREVFIYFPPSLN